MKIRFHVGMRKIKSLLAVVLTFIIWQLLRILLPWMEVHPLFAYIYAIIEMRDNPEKTKSFGKLRIKATFIGLIIGLLFVALSIRLCAAVSVLWQQTLIEFILVLIASLLALCVAEMADCKNFCGIAAIITVICMVSHTGEDRYLYAIMRVSQTLLGVFAAAVVNSVIHKPRKQEEPGEKEPEDNRQAGDDTKVNKNIS